MRCGFDVRQSDLHFGADLHAEVFDLLLYANLSAVSVV